MKKIFFSFAAIAVAFVSCTKEKAVTIDHPVSVDMEPDAVVNEFPVQFFDLTGASCEDETLKSYLDKEADVLLFTAPFERAAWIQATLEATGYEFNVISVKEENMCIAAASAVPAGMKTVQTGSHMSPCLSLGKTRLVVSVLSAEQELQLLNETYVQHSEYGWVYAVRLGAASKTFAGAAFTDCYLAQWGEKFLWEGRRNFLYASPGCWNNVRKLDVTRFAGLPSPVYSFNIVSEEDAI